VAGYSLGRIAEELVRVDPAHHILGLRLNFYVATILFVVGIVWFVRVQRAQTGDRAGPEATEPREPASARAGGP
jgi:prolipoprotein diacylglyceryltransferase